MNGSMKYLSIALLSLVALAAAIAGGIADQGASGNNPVPLSIHVDRNVYTPLMSSTVGIGVTPDYPSSVDNGTVNFRWQTDYGYFLSWGSDSRVSTLGRDITLDDSKVYWSYEPGAIDLAKPPVRITLTMIDRLTGKLLGTSTLDLGWEDRGTAVVSR